MPRVHCVKKAAKAYPDYGIKKGETYYWWKFRYGGKRMSKTPPKRSQLTQSSFLSTLYDIEDNWGLDREDPEGSLEDLKSQLQDLLDECQGNLDNMPDNLRENSDSGQLLQERIDGLEGWISTLEGIDLEIEEVTEEDLDQDELDSIEAMVAHEQEDNQTDYSEKEWAERRKAILEDRLAELNEEKRDERINEIEQEAQDANPGLG